MTVNNLKIYWKKGWISFLACLFCFAYLLRFSWLKWGDLIIDSGREMYVPWMIYSGKLLYRDIFYLYGPFSPYFNSLVFKIFGVHINSLIVTGIITAAVCTILVYKISRIFLNIFFSTLSALTFLFVFSFGQYVYLANYNFILPYSYPAIHGMMFSLFALYFFYRAFFKKNKFVYFYALCAILVFLCRIEIGVSLILAIALAIVIYGIIAKANFRQTFKLLSVYILAPLATACVVYGLFFIAAANNIGRSNLFYIALENFNTKSSFTGFLSGMDNLSGNTIIMFKVFLYYFILAIIFSSGGLIFEKLNRPESLVKQIGLSFLLGIIFILLPIVFSARFISYDLQFRCMPLLGLLTIFISIYKFKKDKDCRLYLFLAAVSFYSLFLLTRMFFHVWAGHYGFYLLVPGMIIYYVFFLEVIPGLLNSKAAGRFIKSGFFCLFILFIFSHFVISRSCYLNKTLKISTDRGVLYTFNNPREQRCKELVDFLLKDSNEKESLVVFPEGLAINFLTKIKNPLYYYSYLPQELAKPEISQNIISEMKDNKIEYLALVGRDTAEYGYAVFGRDYASQIWKYISDNYQLYKQFGPFPFTDKEFGIALFKNKGGLQ